VRHPCPGFFFFVSGPCPFRFERSRFAVAAATAGRQGFTAVEVLVAIAIIGLAVSPILGLFSSGARQALLAEARVQALAVAEQALIDWEVQAVAGNVQVYASSPERAEDGELKTNAEPGEEPAQSATAEEEPVRCELTAEELDGMPGLWRVSVTVDWVSSPGGKRQSSTLTLEKLFSAPALALKHGAPAEQQAETGAEEPV
jgi:prepilin-type N-terminal cleavage/methylation domain-containing protein